MGGKIGNGMDVVAVDISGRHEVKGKYYMVSASVAARISPRSLERVHAIRQIPAISSELNRNVVMDLILRSCAGLEGTIVAERGDLYNLEEWRVCGILGREFRYPRSLGEIMVVEIAHHVSISGRRLLWGRSDGGLEMQSGIQESGVLDSRFGVGP